MIEFKTAREIKKIPIRKSKLRGMGNTQSKLNRKKHSKTLPKEIAEGNKSADLACEFYGMISDPGAKTLAWPRGRQGGSAGEGGRGGRVHAFLLGGPGRSGQSSETAFVRFWLLLGAT